MFIYTPKFQSYACHMFVIMHHSSYICERAAGSMKDGLGRFIDV